MHAHFHDPEPTHARAMALGAGEERMARIAARRAFVEMKTAFSRAAAHIDGSLGERLHRKVRQASEAVELWRLRGAILSALSPHDAASAEHRMELHRQLDSVFPDSGADTSFVPLERHERRAESGSR